MQFKVVVTCNYLPMYSLLSHYLYFRYGESELPTTADELKSWLNEIWRQKEERLANFSTTSSFVSNTQTVISDNQHTDNALYLALMFWTLVQVCKRRFSSLALQ